MQLEQTATGTAADQSLDLSFNVHQGPFFSAFLIIYLGWPFSEPPPTKP